MKIKDIELFHGAVITRLMRKDRPVALKMFEFDADNYRSVYILMDDEGDKPLYIKHSRGSQPSTRYEIKKKWNFTFHVNHFMEIDELIREYGTVYIILVCGEELIGADDTYIVLLPYDDLSKCVDVTGKSGQQNVKVGDKGGRNYLRVWGTNIHAKDSFGVSENKIFDL